MNRWRRPRTVARINRTAAAVQFPEAIWKTCPWQPRDRVETGLRQWLRCAGAALRDGRIIGMPSHAVDEAWHGFILCTALYARFCDEAYGRFLHHHPDGTGPSSVGAMHEQLGRTVVAWTMVAEPGERCVLWDLDERVGVHEPWGVSSDRIADITVALGSTRQQ